MKAKKIAFRKGAFNPSFVRLWPTLERWAKNKPSQQKMTHLKGCSSHLINSGRLSMKLAYSIQLNSKLFDRIAPAKTVNAMSEYLRCTCRITDT